MQHYMMPRFLDFQLLATLLARRLNEIPTMNLQVKEGNVCVYLLYVFETNCPIRIGYVPYNFAEVRSIVIHPSGLTMSGRI